MGLAQSGLPEETPLYALDKYVQLQRVCFLSAFDLEKVIDIDHIVREIGLVFFFFFFRSGLALSWFHILIRNLMLCTKIAH